MKNYNYFISLSFLLVAIFFFSCNQNITTSDPPDTTPPSPPVIKGITPIEGATATWTWDISSDVAKVYYQLDSTSDNWNLITDMKIKSHSETVTEDGTYTLYIKSQDAVGNFSTINSFAILVDNTGISPTRVDITSDITIATNKSPIRITVIFNEVVLGFTQDKISVTNATVTKFQQGINDKNYNIEITPISEGQVSVEISANMVTDLAGNGNESSNKYSVIYDITPPIVKEKILSSDIIVIENPDFVLNSLNFTEETDITSDYYDNDNKIILTDLAGNSTEIINVYDGIDTTDGLKYAVETLSDATIDWDDIYIMDGTYDMTPLATTLNINKAINIYGDYKKTFIDCSGGVNIITVGDTKGKVNIKDLIIGSSINTAVGINGVGFAVDGNILQVSGLKTLKSGNLLNVKTYNGSYTENSPYIMIPNESINYSFFQDINTAGDGWRKSEHNSNNDQQPKIKGNMTID